ncbi:MAG: YceI family protein [Anaerolineae bacterium]
MPWNVDTAHSRVQFAVKHMMISTARGDFTKFGGALNLDPNDFTKSSLEGWAEVASITTNDTQRDAHLRSADFFDADNFPKIAFTVNKITRTDDDDFKVTGDLTIRGVTRPVVWEVEDEGQATDPWGNDRWGFHAKTKINRKDFGLNWNVALEKGGWLVGEEVKVDIDLEAIFTPEAQPETAGATA